MKALKLWQAILLIFGSICLVTGGVVLYTYLTSGFGNPKIEAETISFVKNDKIFNAQLNQLEVDSDFSLTITASNEAVSEKEITLSFGKSSSGNVVETFVVEGVTYISNGVVSIPQKVVLGEEFIVKLDQITYSYNGKTFDANAGGITTIKAKSSNILDSAGAEITVAVDVPVEKIDLTVKDTTTGKISPIDANGASKVLQNANFELIVNYYPTLSRYRYSDNYFKAFHEGQEVLNTFEERVKDYCFEVVAGNNVEKKYNNGDIYFSSTGMISSGNKVKAYAFQTAKKQEDFESAGLTITGEDYYNAMLSYLAKATSGVSSYEVNFSVEQADVGNIHISLNTTEATPLEANTNKLFTLVANNDKLGDASLGLAIQDEEGADLSSMISQTALRIRYKKLGEVDFVNLEATDDTVVVRSLDKFVLGDKPDTVNPYVYEGKTYFFGNSNIKNLKNTYWEISTNEDSILVEVEAVLFITTGSGPTSITSIFDEAGAKLTPSMRRKAYINFIPSEEGDVAWGSTNEQLNIIYNGTTQVPTQLDLAKNTNVPSGNIYQKVRYYLAKVLDGETPPAVDTISEDDANVDMTQTYTHTDGHSYALVKASDLLFKEAGTYYALFVTVRTDAYGNIVDTDPAVDGVQVGFEEVSNIMTITVAKTLQQFTAKISVEDGEKYGVFRSVPQASVDVSKTDYYYKKAIDGYSYELEVGTPNPATTIYYELNYYAVMTGEEGAITVDIQVSESDCTMINTELANNRLKFYAISSDGQNEIELNYTDSGTKTIDIGGTPCEIIKVVKLDMPNMTISDNNGRGKSFYIKIVYDNTVEKVHTLATMDEYGLSVEEDGGVRVHNCFMLYTPTARNIYSPVIKEEIVGPDTIYHNLANQTIDANISMNSEAKYENCDILLGGEVLNGADNGKVWINERIKETVVTDAYERLYVADQDLNGNGIIDPEEERDEYEVGVSAGIVSVGVFNNELIFASGKENATITVSAGANCFYSFVIRTESSGLHKVRTTTFGAAPVETEFTSFSNVYVNIDGEKSGNTWDYLFISGVEIEVGSPDPAAGGAYVELDDNHKFFYLNDFDIENMSMFEFTDLDGNVYNTVYGSSYATDFAGTYILSNKVPLRSIKFKENFARSYTLSIAVSSEDYRTSTDTPAVSFELKVNISSVVSAVANINDKFVFNDANSLEDGIYAGVPYELDKLIALTRITDDSDIHWGITGPYHALHYVLNDGEVTTEDDATRNDGRVSVGEIAEGKIKFYDVIEVTNRYAKFFYFEENENAYYTEATFKVYPNLKIVAVATPDEYINLIELAKNGAVGKALSRYCETARIRSVAGAIAPSTTFQILNGSGYVVGIDGGNFKFQTGKSLDLGYGDYDDVLQLGLYLNGNRVLLPSGTEQIYEIPVVLIPDTYDALDPTILTGSVETELLPYVFKDASGNNIGTVVYDGVTALNVCYPFAGDYIVNTNQFGGADKPFFINVGRDNIKVYNYQNEKVNFLPAVADSIDGFSFGEKYYLSVIIKGGSTDVNTVFDVAKIKIPLYISTVGQHYAYYNSYNDGHPDDPATGTNEYVAPTDGFDLKTLLYGEVDGDHLAPYSTREAGNYYQIAFKYNGDYAKVGGDYAEGIYYDDNVTLDNITFENGTRECDYGRILISASGDWYLHLANLANEEKYLTLCVNLSQGSSLLRYTYRIKVLPNVQSAPVYPFATGANGAEYETISNDTTFDLAKPFGSYAGDKADNTRYALTIATNAGQYSIDETTEYYLEDGVIEDVNGYKVVPAGSKLYSKEAVEIATISSDIQFSLESVGESVELVPASGEYFVPVVFTTAKYQIAELRVGGNTVDSGDGAIFNDFVNSGDAYTKELATGVMFVVIYEIDGDTKKYTILANDQVIAKISLSESGKLEFKDVDSAYFINLVISKIYNNIIDGNIDYRLNINNTSGINYIEYKDGGNPLPSKEDDLGIVETAIETDKVYTLQTKYTTGNGTSNKDLDLTYTVKLEDRRGDEVATLTEALSASGQGNLDAPASNDKTTYGVLLVKDNSGNFTLYINRATFVNQDYKLRIFFNAKTFNENGEEESFRVSEFVVTIRSSVTATLKPDAIPVLTAGTSLTRNDITSFFDVSGGTITAVRIESMENGKPCAYADGSRLADMIEDVEEKYYDFELAIGANTVYISLPFSIEANIVPLAQYRYAEAHYATDEITVTFDHFYTNNSFGSVTAAYSIPETFKDYIQDGSVSTTNPNVKLSTEHVATKVKNVKLNLTFTYTFGTYSYSFNSALVFDIEPFAKLSTHTPNPEKVAGGELEYESVIFANAYKDFFSSYANFVDGDDLPRLEIVKSEDGSEPVGAYNDIVVNLKQISGIEVYAKVKVNTAADFGDYYRVFEDGGKIKYFYHAQGAGETYEGTNTYYILFNPRQLEVELEGDQEFVFMPYGSYADGFAVFDIEYNKVKTIYKVYAFKEIIEKVVVNSVNYVDGVEEIFLEQLAEGNILAEDTLACLEMSATVPSGTYYIKLNNPGDSVNPKHWIGFKYDATKSTTIYVHLGQVGYIDEARKNDAGYIEGIFASKTSANDLRENGTILLSLTSFLNLKYVTMINGEKTFVDIDRDYDYTSILEATINRDGTEITGTIPEPLFKDVDGKYYTIDANGNKVEETINEALLKKALYGNYEVFDDYVNWDGNKDFVSIEEEVIEDSGNGFGQAVEDLTGTLGSDGSEVYRYTDAEGDNVYVKTGTVTRIYDTALKVVNPSKKVYNVEYNKNNVNIGTSVTKQGVDTISNPFIDPTTGGYVGYRVYLRPADLKFNPITAYEVANVAGIDTNISYNTNTGTWKKLFVFAGTIDGLKLGSTRNQGTLYREIEVADATTFNAYKSLFDAYDNGSFHTGAPTALTFSASHKYYILESRVTTHLNEEVFSGVFMTYYTTTAFGGTMYFDNTNKFAHSAASKVHIKAGNTGDTTLNLGAIAGWQNKLIADNGSGSAKVETLTDKALNTMSNIIGNNFEMGGKKYYVENITTDISYTISGTYNAPIVVKLSEQTINPDTYSNFIVDRDRQSLVDSTVDISDIIGTYTNMLPIQMKDGVTYLVKDLTLTDAEAISKVISAGVKDVYRKEKTSRFKVEPAVMVDGLSTVDIDGDGEVDFYRYSGKYFKAKDVISVYQSGATYIIASLQTFNINNIDGLIVNDTAIVKFNYILDNHVGQFEFKFKINMDADVKNSLLGTEYTKAAQKLLDAYGEEVKVANEKSINVIELETNRTYDFNQLVGAIRPSSGETITAEDVRSSSDMSLEVLSTASIYSELPKIGMSAEDIDKFKEVLGTDFKDNSDIIRLSYELVRTNDNIHGKVYNFNLLPLGADNNGDYVLVKYSYNIEVSDYIWKTSDHETYSISRYVLFHILPDYEVSMTDADKNPVVIETTLTDINNYDNPVLITNFEAIGDIETTGRTLEDVLRDSTIFTGGNHITSDIADDLAIELGTTTTIGGKQVKVAFRFEDGYGQTTVTDKNQNYSAVVVSIGTMQKTYFFRSVDKESDLEIRDSGGGDFYVKAGKVVIYENVQLPITTTSQSGFVRVVATNASVDATKNVVSSLFGATLQDYHGGADIESYLGKSYTKDKDGNIMTGNTLARGSQTGLKLSIKQIIALGERNFHVVLVDDYGFTINFYFSMVATANPAYASGMLEFEETKTFDIGAQFEEVSISQYEVDTTKRFYYQVGEISKKEFENAPSDTYFVEVSGANYTSYTIADATYAPTGATNVKLYTNETLAGLTAGAKSNMKDIKAGGVTWSASTQFFKRLDDGDVVNETSGVNIELNLPLGYGNKGTYTTMTTSTDTFVAIPTSILTVSADGLSTIVKSPEEKPGVMSPAEQAIYENYVDTIELTGISAFGYKKANMSTLSSDSSRYFNSTCDLDKIVIKQLEYKYQGVSLKTIDFGGGKVLSSSEAYFKYDSADKMGEYIDYDKYQVPILPGWVYEEKDYAYITLEITLAENTGANPESYVLPIEIKISKFNSNIISQHSVATNVSDDTPFNVKSHIGAAGNWEYYDDTLAVTLPGNGKVSVKVEAQYDETMAGKYWVVNPTNGAMTDDAGLVAAAKATDKDALYVQIDTKFYKAYYSGVKTLYSNFATMDTVQYLGLSQTVGHTLNTNYDVKITFFDYDNTKITRNGNFGFYATYGAGNLAQYGNEDKLATNQTVVETWEAHNYSYAYGYGQLAANANVGEFTLFANGEKFIDADGVEKDELVVFPTEAIERGDDDKIVAGTNYIKHANFSNKVREEKVIEINNGTGGSDKWQQHDNNVANYDKINIPDAGNFAGGKLLITKYYIAKSIANGESYQFLKDYNVYPKYFDISTSDPINNRIEAQAGMEENVGGIDYHTFELGRWGTDVSLTYYNPENNANLTKLFVDAYTDGVNDLDISPFYFELGEKGTTSAMIDPETGKLYAKKSEYKLNGDEYVSINIYVKASGENSEFVDDNLPFSGNDNNKPMINVKIYLNSGLSPYERITMIEETHAADWSNPEEPSMTNRDKVLGYFRSADNSYTTAEWTAFAGKTTKIVSDFVPLVAEDAFLSSFRGMGAFAPSADWTMDFTHFFGALDMYNNTVSKSYNMVSLTPQQMADLGGWGGDLASILAEQIAAGVTSEATAYANAYSLIKATAGSSFGLLDYCANIDASNVWHTQLKSNATIKIGAAMEAYYNAKTTQKQKVETYLANDLTFTYNTAVDEQNNITNLTTKIKARIIGNNGIKGYIAKVVLGPSATAAQLASFALTFATTYDDQIHGVCEAYATRLIRDLA